MSHISEQADNHKAEGFIPSNSWGSDVAISSDAIARNLLEIKEKTAHYNSRIIAVTKYYGVGALVNAYKAGVRDFGESRVIDAIEKIKALPEDVRKNSTFHFIGHLQTNKAEKAVEYFDCIQSVDSLKLSKVIADKACSLNKREKILLQVNNAGEEQKFGYTKKQLIEDLPEILKLESLEVVGLMNIAPFDISKEELRRLFADMREFKKELETKFDITMTELSMGMSNDYELALEEGATMIRVGRKLFK